MDLQIDDDVSFQLGEMFDSYEEMKHKLDQVSKRSLVHYWRRDSRTVTGAHMKTSRPISEKLKYYSVKYACIYGGQKFLPRGAGRRQSQSIRTNCPAHIMLRASKDGTKLEVTSVNNDHNHEISEELFKKLPQERKLCGEIRRDVQDLMALHIDRKRVKEYVRLKTNKDLRSKDLFNIAAANKPMKEISEERALELFQNIKEVEKQQKNRENEGKAGSESEEEITQRIKRIKTEAPRSPWGQEEFSTELEASEGNDCEGAFTPIHEEEEMQLEASEGQLIHAHSDGEIISTGGEIVGELVMEDGDPSVIVESIVNVDGSVFVEESEFKNYYENHLNHDEVHDEVHDEHSPDSQVLDIDPIPDGVDMKLSRNPDSPASVDHMDELSPSMAAKSTRVPTGQIWVSAAPDPEVEGYAENDTSVEREKNVADNCTVGNEVGEVIFSEDASQQLLIEQLAVLRAEKGKLFQETEMLKLKKDKLRIQINCFTNEIRKQEMEKEKLRLEIKLLRSKLVEDANDVSLIYVP